MRGVHLLILATLLCASAAYAGTPLSANHPLLGTWMLRIPGKNCQEIYQVRGDGTTLVTSAAEVAQSEFTVSEKPSAKGFYKWVDKVVKDNGGKDCSGNISKPGHEVTLYLRFHPSGNLFLLCEKEDLNTCFGPFVRQKEEDI